MLRTRGLFQLAPYRTTQGKHRPINRMMDIYNKHSETIDITMQKDALRKALTTRDSSRST